MHRGANAVRSLVAWPIPVSARAIGARRFLHPCSSPTPDFAATWRERIPVSGRIVPDGRGVRLPQSGAGPEDLNPFGSSPRLSFSRATTSSRSFARFALRFMVSKSSMLAIMTLRPNSSPVTAPRANCSKSNASFTNTSTKLPAGRVSRSENASMPFSRCHCSTCWESAYDSIGTGMPRTSPKRLATPMKRARLSLSIANVKSMSRVARMNPCS